MKTGIVGLPHVGKTTIFQVLTRASHELVRERSRRAQPNVGVVKVPDARVDFLASVFEPLKTTHATIEFVDVVGLVRGQGRDLALDPVRDVDAMIHVVRAFDDGIPDPRGSADAERDIRDFETELILNDLQSVEKRLERLTRERKKIKDSDLEREHELLGRIREWLESERPLREMDFTPDESKRMRGFAFLSQKPMIYAINVGEDQITHGGGPVVREAAEGPNTARVLISGKLEAEMAQLGDEDLAMFLADYGLQESGMMRLIRTAYELLGLISFLTAGPEECRAWTIRKGTTAQRAAGAIHSDLEKHFIRAEVSSFGDFRRYPSFAALREQGLLRLEGKEYVVKDGDIITVRHSG
jgi:GTP-binding protein YchF